MGSGAGKPPKTAEEGARILYNLAVNPIDNITGRYFENPTPDGTADGAARDWPGF